ncbi:MAG: diguanylate cyclase, partial [Pseudomonadota bacterium]
MAPVAAFEGKETRANRWPERLAWLREICFVSFGRDPLTSKIRRAQVATLRDMLPATNLVALFNAMLLVIALRHFVPAVDLGVWLTALFGLVAARLYHVLGGGSDEATPLTVYLMVLGSALMWSVPPLLWHSHAPPHQQLLIFLVTVGMMCGGSVTLASMPIACWTFVLILGAVMTVLDLHIGQPILAVMTVGFTLMLCWIGLRHARSFVEHQRDSIELEEQSELVKLMREFKASGSGWLWETNERLMVTYLTSDGGRLSLRRIRRLLGRRVADILDPGGRTTQVSEGAQALFAHFEEHTPFRDIAVPTRQGRWWSLSGKPMFDKAGRFAGWRGLGSDITESRVDGQDAVQAARRDPLTDLANRLLVREAIEEALLWAPANSCSLLLVDLDRFKLVNDTLGHAVGDMLLKEVANRLARTAGADALVGRLGGDEFAIVLPGTTSRARLGALANRLIADLSAVYPIGGIELHIGATVGIAVAPDDASSQEELTTSADLALYRAKEEGRGTHCFYERWMSERAQAHRQIESDLRGALQSGGLSLVYQPFVEAKGKQVVGYEALLRWRHPLLGDIPPDQFVPIIEDAGLMNQIGTWVIREACAEAAGWPGPERIAVNVSATQINGTSLAGTVITALAETGLAADRLERAPGGDAERAGGGRRGAAGQAPGLSLSRAGRRACRARSRARSRAA